MIAQCLAAGGVQAVPVQIRSSSWAQPVPAVQRLSISSTVHRRPKSPSQTASAAVKFALRTQPVVFPLKLDSDQTEQPLRRW
jgi:hypothetical protein